MQLTLPIPGAAWTIGGPEPLPRARRIYCNRNLRLDQITHVGFDMDYTLAIYRQPEMDRLSIEETARKLVDRGYPELLLSMPYRTDYPIRGLLVDKKLGNILKMDRYKYVKKAYHGFRRLSLEERRTFYHSRRLRPSSRRYHWVDTLYALSEVSVFAAAIEELERQNERVDYDRLFSDVRECIDLAHRDGSIVDKVIADLPRYVIRDPKLGFMLHRLRSSGKKLFLLTNSRAAYTDGMMRYLLDGVLPGYESWRNYFDVVLTASRKPHFFTHVEPFVEVTRDGASLPVNTVFERGRVYAGGNIADFARMAAVSGEQVLYIGDHIYGDVLRAKKEAAWRTAMIIQEMEDELHALERCHDTIAHLDQLQELHANLTDELREARESYRVVQRRIEGRKEQHEPIPPDLDAVRVTARRKIERLRARLHELDAELNVLEGVIDDVFHPFWGSLFKAGTETSSFGNQVERYACLYTDRVSNFGEYSAKHYFRSPRDIMPHEL